MEDASAILSLPDDPAILKQIIVRERDPHRQRTERLSHRVDELEVAKLRLEMELLRLKKWYYGPRADRLQTPGDVAQMLLAFSTESEARPVNPGDLPPGEPLPEVGAVRRVRCGRRNLAALENLPVIRKEHDLPEDQKRCPCCGDMRQRIGQETSWQVEFIPGRFERIEHVRFKYACKQCEQNAENPQITLADARRKFVDAEKSHPQIAAEAVGWIKRLYAIEERGKALEVAARVALRQQESVPIMSALKDQLFAWRDQLLPKHPMSEAVGYVLNQWEELNVFATDGAVSVDNNACEREMKRICLNRKNSLFVGNERGGATAAILSSITSTCRRHGVDPQRYLMQLLTNLPVTPIGQIEQWLPDQWKLRIALSSG